MILLCAIFIEFDCYSFGSLMQRADSFGKTLILGKTEDKEEKLTTKDEVVRWHHRLNGYESG